MLEPSFHFGGKGFQLSQNQTQFPFYLCLLFEALYLCFKVLHSFAHPAHSRFKFLFINQSVGIAVD